MPGPDSAYCLGILSATRTVVIARLTYFERDVLRPKLLRAFGWKIVHVLTKDWYEDSAGVLKMLECMMKS